MECVGRVAVGNRERADDIVADPASPVARIGDLVRNADLVDVAQADALDADDVGGGRHGVGDGENEGAKLAELLVVRRLHGDGVACNHCGCGSLPVQEAVATLGLDTAVLAADDCQRLDLLLVRDR